ncbi:MAG: sugar ABC transporter permease [Thermomicrobiales bacterium]
MVIYLAALQNSEHLYEAAELDGAGFFRRLGTVTIPMMSPVIFFNLVLGVIGALQVFTSAYIITQGGPQNSTRFYTLMIYDRAFDQFRMGYASGVGLGALFHHSCDLTPRIPFVWPHGLLRG